MQLAQFQITDIAGLVKGASKGEGLGNAFLSHINLVDGIYHVVRAFKGTDVIHEQGVNPIRDIETVNNELLLKDLQQVETVIEGIEHAVNPSRKKARKNLK